MCVCVLGCEAVMCLVDRSESGATNPKQEIGKPTGGLGREQRDDWWPLRPVRMCVFRADGCWGCPSRRPIGPLAAGAFAA